MQHKHTGRWVVTVLVGFILGGLAYVRNLSLFLSLACAGGPLLAWLWVSAFAVEKNGGPSWVQRYRFLLVVYTPVLMLGAWELSGEIVAEKDMAEADMARIYLRGTANYADVMLGLYPGREEYRFLKGQQLGFCSSLPRPQEFMLCRQLGPVSAARIRQEFERALRSGITSNGDLLNLYLSVLKEDGASAEQIEQVRRMLLRHHPALLPPGGE